MKYTIVLLLILNLLVSNLWSQNTVVTDDDSYGGNNSAMLDVYSKTKGLLVPRMTTAEREAIVSPATGLLVFDETEKQFYVCTNSVWNLLDAPSIWQTDNDSIYVTGNGKRFGVGTASPIAKLTVQGDATIAPDEPLFEVKNSEGDVIFAVYENEVKVNFKESDKGVKGGFAVGGLSGTKADPVEYMRITPDSVRIYIDDSGTKGVKGGFAVGGLSGTKGGNQYFKLDEESASIYLKQPAKGVKGGFAVGGLSGTKGAEDFLTIERDSARIYINNANKGVKGGFAVGGLSGTKSDDNNFLSLTPENYFIGQGAGANNTIGLNNTFFGYYSGYSNTAGSQNIFMGYYSGYTNTTASNNIFIGNSSGFSNETGETNIFIGTESGYSNVSGDLNTCIGFQSGYSLDTANYNTFIGFWSGRSNQNGALNTYLGAQAGEFAVDGNLNVIIGAYAGSEGDVGDFNTFVGMRAGNKNSGNSNTIIGGYAGYNNADGNSNVFIGQASGEFNNGSGNVFVGNGSGVNNNGTSNIFIGDNAGANISGSNRLLISNFDADSSQALIYGEFDNQILQFNARIGIGTSPDEFEDLTILDDGSSGGLKISGYSDGYDVATITLESEADNSLWKLTHSQSSEFSFVSYDGSNWNLNIQLDMDGNMELFNGGITSAGSFYINRTDSASTDNEIYFADYGQIRSNDDNHRIIFDRGNDILELREYGNIVLSAGANMGQRTETMVIRNGSAVLDGYLNPASDDMYTLGDPGNRWSAVYATNGTIQTSDGRLKSNVMALSYGLTEIMKLKPVFFNWKGKENENKKIGFIAQEVDKVITEAVHHGNDDMETLGINYSDLIPVLVKSTQEQQMIIEQQQKQINELIKANDQMKKLIEAIANQ